MKLIQFAVASIVDANTGGSYARHVDSIDTREAERNAHAIRARSIFAVGRAIRNAIGDALERRRDAAEKRRALNDLLALNDHHLADIGLHRGDLVAVKLGATTLETLSAEREARRNVKSAQLVARIGGDKAADNDEGLAAVQCA